MRFRYTPEQLRFIEREYQKVNAAEVARRFNERFGLQKSHKAIRSVLKNYGITCGRPPGNPKGTYRLFTPEQAEWIRRAYRRMTRREIAAELGRRFGLEVTEQQVKTFTQNHDMKSGRTGRFRNDSKPWNKGLHYTAGGRSAETRFRKGHRPKNWVPIGTEVTDPDGYLKRKISDGGKPGESRFNWKFVHILAWEEQHGPVPDDHAVIFRNGDKSDIRIENLALVSRAELLYLNRKGLAGLGEQLSPAAEALAKLEVKRFERKKEAA